MATITINPTVGLVPLKKLLIGDWFLFNSNLLGCVLSLYNTTRLDRTLKDYEIVCVVFQLFTNPHTEFNNNPSGGPQLYFLNEDKLVQHLRQTTISFTV